MLLFSRTILLVPVSALALFCAPAGAQVLTDPAPPSTEQTVPVADPAPAGAGRDTTDVDAAGAETEADPAAVPPSGQTAEQELLDQFRRYKELIAEDILDEADNVAKRVVELAIQTKGPRSEETAKALTNLAIVQHKNEEHVAAQQNFEQAIDIIEFAEDRLTRDLINPLKGLGASQLESGRPDLAIRTLGRAVHISHVNEGPHNAEQIDLLEVLAESNVRIGETDRAKDIYDMIYSINSKRFENDELGMVPSLMRRAAWQHRAGYINDERATYRRIIRIVESETGKNDLALIEPLQLLGRSYFFVDLSGDQSLHTTTAATGEIYFKRALRIAEDSPDATWETLAEAQVSLGDYYMYAGSLSRARAVYSDAWQVMSADETRHDLRERTLGRAIPLRKSPLPRYAGDAAPGYAAAGPDGLREGSISYEFSVTERGQVAGLRIIEAQPAEFDDIRNAVRRELRSRLYRPRHDNGEPVTTDGMGDSHTFFYREEELEALRDDAATNLADSG